MSIIMNRRFTVSLSALAVILNGKKSETLNEGYHWGCESKTLLTEQGTDLAFP